MKLYTSDQVKMMLIKAKVFDGNVSDNFVFIMSEDEILESETHIELPSDEEIEEEALKREYFELSFFNGAKIVISKIQGGNK